MNFERNNLDTAASPYLQQHKDNPIWWQEWNEVTFAHAKKHNKLIFVSIGYSTCHWCHVMANEAFSDRATADYLNAHFVSIKVDREQRPDIDQYFMEYVRRTQDGGGWPLNVVLDANKRPFFGGTYFPTQPTQGRPSLQEVLEQVVEWHKEHSNEIIDFHIDQSSTNVIRLEETKVLRSIMNAYDAKHAGFGITTKFPPHSTLLFLMHEFEITQDPELQKVITKTLNAMGTRGLHDHLQGGFFRYCVDREWTIPHFEKMLYDQAMLLWVYSIAVHLFGRQEDKVVVEKLIRCLEETFAVDNLYVSAHDADTAHEEGATYVWDIHEIEEVLTQAEMKEFGDVYAVSAGGNFEGKNHLIKTRSISLPEIEEKLLEIRKKRTQPFVDEKIVTVTNALVGIGMIMAYRYAGVATGLEKAQATFDALLTAHMADGVLAHSSLHGVKQQQEFLEDAAALLLLATYLHEEGVEQEDTMKRFLTKLDSFYDAEWYTNQQTSDFAPIPASVFDHPTPSPVSLAEFSKLRAKKLLGHDDKPPKEMFFQIPLQSDFYNLVVLFNNGFLHEIHNPATLPWSELPIHSLQIRDAVHQDCYQFQCRKFDSEAELQGVVSRTLHQS